MQILTTTTGKELVNLTKTKHFDILFIDINLGDSNGIHIAKEIRSYNNECIIVFITGFVNYAFKAYSVRPLTFLLKPITEEHFKKCIDMVSEQFENSKIVKKNQRKIDQRRISKIYRT